MGKFEIIDQLENRFIQMPNGKWHQVKNGQVEIDGMFFNLVMYHVARLEGFLKRSKAK